MKPWDARSPHACSQGDPADSSARPTDAPSKTPNVTTMKVVAFRMKGLPGARCAGCIVQGTYPEIRERIRATASRERRRLDGCDADRRFGCAHSGDRAHDPQVVRPLACRGVAH